MYRLASPAVALLQYFISWHSIDRLLPPARRILVDKEEFGLLPTCPGRYMARRILEFRCLVFESAVAEAAGHVMQAPIIRFFQCIAGTHRDENRYWLL